MTGLTVEGHVSGYAKGKAIVRLLASKESGIIGVQDVELSSLNLKNFKKKS